MESSVGRAHLGVWLGGLCYRWFSDEVSCPDVDILTNGTLHQEPKATKMALEKLAAAITPGTPCGPQSHDG